jgi:hypothetical protein
LRGIGLKIGTLGDRATSRCTLLHKEEEPNPSKPTGLGVNQGPLRVPHGWGKVLLKDQATKMEEQRDRGKGRAAAAVRWRERKGRAGGEEIRKGITAGGLYTAVKSTAGTTGFRGQYHRRARDLRDEFCGILAYRCYRALAGTTGWSRYHRC